MNGEFVRDAMRRGVVSCEAGLGLREAAKLMTESDVRALIVMDETCGLAGIVSTSDLVNASLKQSTSPGETDLAIKDIMTRDVLTITPDTPLSQAAKLMIDRHVHRLVVIEENESKCIPIGVLSMSDVVRRISEA